MSQRQNISSSGKSILLALKRAQKINFAFCDIRRVFTDRITYQQYATTEFITLWIRA